MRFLGFVHLRFFLNNVIQAAKSNLSPIYYKKQCINKSVSKKPIIRSTRFLKPKTNFSPNDYSKHCILTGKRLKAFNVKGGKNNLCLERIVLSIPLQMVHDLSKFGGCSRSKIRRYKTLSKSRDTSVIEAK